MKLRAAILSMMMVAGVAHADTRAWTAARKVLPAHLGWIVGARLDAADAKKAVTGVVKVMTAKHPEDAQILGEVKLACGAAPEDLIDSIVAASTDDPDDGAVVIALRGLDRGGFDACIKKLAAGAGATVTVKATGPISTYSDGSDSITIKWLDKDILMFALDADKPKKLDALSAGGLAGDKAMLALVAKAKPDATAWAAIGLGDSTDISGVPVKVVQVYGHADLAGGNVSGEVHIVTTDARAAAQAAAKQQAEDAKMLGQSDVPAPVKAFFRGLTIKASGKDLVVSAALPFDQLVDAGLELAR